MKKPLLTAAHSVFLANTVARNRSRFGGWFMEEDAAATAAREAAEKAATDKAAAEKEAADKAAAEAAAPSKNALDSEGKDLGYPKDTAVVEMTDSQQAAYHRYHSRKHETRYKDLVGDRSAEDIKKDLEELARIRREKQTPSEQAINDAREEGKKEALKAERNNTATALFRGALEGSDALKDDDIDELVTNFNVANFITDDGVDTTKISNFAKKFTKSDTDESKETRRRDYGAGNRSKGGEGGPKSVKQVMDERRAAREAK